MEFSFYGGRGGRERGMGGEAFQNSTLRRRQGRAQVEIAL
jgi:hypothetical protein